LILKGATNYGIQVFARRVGDFHDQA
jgi:hypothetical protein